MEKSFSPRGAVSLSLRTSAESFAAASRKKVLESSFVRPAAVCLVLGLSLASVGCHRAPEKPAQSPLMEAKKDERILEQERQDLERRHLAPPPAYGNKVVMAEAAPRPTGTM